MNSFPINYHEPVFRPPAEAQSLILQVTYGCSWNKCAFCEMYTSKKFYKRNEQDIFDDIEAFIPYSNHIRRVFLADGDPLVMPTATLLNILNKITDTFPRLQRVSAYASPSNLRRKSHKELEQLYKAGLKLVYIGIESGDDKVLEKVNKGENAASMIDAINKSKNAGLNSSIMIINGIGGREMSKQHALNSARIINEVQPKYLSTLVFTAYKGMSVFEQKLKESFVQLNEKEHIQELKLFIENLQLKETIFRSDHISNSMVLKGVLPRDKDIFLGKIDTVLYNL